MPPAAARHGRARQSLGTGPCGDCRGVVSIVVPFVPRRLFGQIRFIVPQGVNGHRRPVLGAPSSGAPRKSQAKLRDGTVWGL